MICQGNGPPLPIPPVRKCSNCQGDLSIERLDGIAPPDETDESAQRSIMTGHRPISRKMLATTFRKLSDPYAVSDYSTR